MVFSIRWKQVIIVLVFAWGCLFPGNLSAQDWAESFEIAFLALTPQDRKMDWWYAIPGRFGPKLYTLTQVAKGQPFMILPVFNNYGMGAGNQVEISYDLEIIKPDGSVYQSMGDIEGCRSTVPAPCQLPARKRILFSFEAEDPLGDYAFCLTAKDHVSNQTATQVQKVSLKAFHFKKFTDNWHEWFFSYPVRPKPSAALSAFVNSSVPVLDKKRGVVWSTIWFYKSIYENNDFLVPHTVDFFKNEANRSQKKDIVLLFHLLGKADMISTGRFLKSYLKKIEKIQVPDPYGDITRGDQLDMLWAEFFATARIKPVRQLVRAFNYAVHAGTLEKIKSGEMDKSDEHIRAATRDAIFRSAGWSIKGNCKRSPLLFQYCAWLMEKGDLNDMERKYLGTVLNEVSKQMTAKPKDQAGKT